jgi:hypothetical protein
MTVFNTPFKEIPMRTLDRNLETPPAEPDDGEDDEAENAKTRKPKAPKRAPPKRKSTNV